MLWIFNHQWGDWEDSLHSDTRKRLSEDRTGQDIHPKGFMKRELLEGELSDFGGVSVRLPVYKRVHTATAE